MMQFGLTQFGKCTIGAITLISGAALSTADLAGHNEVTRLFAGQGDAYATVTGYGRRAANQNPVTANAYATANTAQAKVTFNPLPSTALATAMANVASARTYLNTYTFATAMATGEGASRRLVKIYPLRADATAEGTGDVQTWQMAYANPALCVATGFGTTYHLTYGMATATATLEDSPRHQVGGQGSAFAYATANQPTALFQIGVKGNGDAFCTVKGDPAVKRAGVRYFEVNGDTIAFANAVNTHVGITQSQTGRCFAYAEGSVRYNFGGHGQAQCFATAVADPQIMGTAATAAPGDSESVGYGRAQVQSKAHGQANSVATATGNGQKTQTRVPINPALAFALVNSPTGNRMALVYGQAAAHALTSTLFVQRGVLPNPGLALGTASAPAINLQLHPPAAEAFANVSGQAYKKQYAEGVGFGLATAIGFNEINDLVPAPADRTILVEAFERLVRVDLEPRLILV